MRSETDCKKFIHDTIDAYTSGQDCPFYEAVYDGVEPELKELSQGECDNKWKHQSHFSLVSGDGNIMVPIHIVFEASEHTGTIDAIISDVPCKVAKANGDNISLVWDSPKINANWVKMADDELRNHATIFKMIRPYSGVLNYLGAILHKVFFLDDSDRAVNYLHLVQKRAWRNESIVVRHWVRNDLEPWALPSSLSAYGISLSLDTPNAGWFDIETLPLAKPKDLIREMYMKVLKRRTKYNLNQLYANAEAQGLLS